MEVISAYDDASPPEGCGPRSPPAASMERLCPPEAIENHPYFTSFGRQNPKYRKMDKHEIFRQAVDDAATSG